MVGWGGGQPVIPGPQARSLFLPSIRGFKIADNMSPIPQDRIFYTFNYFNDVNKTLNEVFEAPIKGVMAYRHLFGLEKTIFGGKGSVGFRLPINVVSASPREPGLGIGGTSTAMGNATFFAKYILEENPRNGNLLTVGLAVTPETGPSSFAGAPICAA